MPSDIYPHLALFSNAEKNHLIANKSEFLKYYDFSYYDANGYHPSITWKHWTLDERDIFLLHKDSPIY